MYPTSEYTQGCQEAWSKRPLFMRQWNQGQPLGNSRFLDAIELATGQRHEVRPRGRPRKPMATPANTSDQLTIDI